jgi:hypothetical protein
MLKKALNKQIVFTPTIDVLEEYLPKPANKVLPEWYKKTKPYIGDVPNISNTKANTTIKKCMPVFDALTMGYIISLYSDVWINKKDGVPFLQWRGGSENLITTHEHAQLSEFPKAHEPFAFKFFNPWAISTPKGYSCLFVPPLNVPNDYFTIFSGVVDTDTYKSPVHFPFLLNDLDYEGIIPAGTPIAQVIPFRREKWQMQIGKKERLQDVKKTDMKINIHWFNAYKNAFWQKKEYK